MKRNEERSRRDRRKRSDSSSSSSSSRSRRSYSRSSSSERSSGRRHSRKKSRRRSRSSSREHKSKNQKNVYIGTNSKDPKMIASRIFVGNLPLNANLKKDDLEDIFKKYGKIIGLLLMSGYAFIQFDNEESAINAKKENGTFIKGGTMEVRLVSEKKTSGYPESHPMFTDPMFNDPYFPPHPGFFGPPMGPMFMGGRMPPPPFYQPDPFLRPPDPFLRPPMVPPRLPPPCVDAYIPPPLPSKNLPPIPSTSKPLAVAIDCEIILVDEEQRAYGEHVMTRLMSSGLTVEVKVLLSGSNTLSMVESAGRKGILFAIIINEQNQSHRSITVNILHGSPQEHRNMPLDDALTLITRSFDKYVITKKERLAAATKSSKVFAPPGQNVVYLLNLLADSRFLTLQELDAVLDYLMERRNILAKSEGLPLWSNNAYSSNDSVWRSQGNMEKRKHPDEGLSPLQEPSPSKQSQKNSGKGLAAVFDNPLVQKAIDNLLTTGPSLLKAVGGGSKQKVNLGQGEQQQHKFVLKEASSPRLNQEQFYNPENVDSNWQNYAGSGY